MRIRARWLLVPCLLGVAAAAGVALFLQSKGVTPRALSPYVAKRASGHNSVIVGVGTWSAATLMRLDRGVASPGEMAFPGIGAQSAGTAAPSGPERLVGTVDELRAAVASANPGDVITLMPGAYRITRNSVFVTRPGAASAPVVVRGQRPGLVDIEVDTAIGFAVGAPYWRFENLSVRGVCSQHQFCEHAFQVTGNGHHFAAVNNTIVDFNAHFKINGVSGRFPDHGLIEANTLRNDSARATGTPVTPIDIVAASEWTIRRNVISDFVKLGGDRISYGAFAKGGGSNNVFEQNAVVCEARLRGAPGQRVGLSLGGGGTGKDYCRDRACIVEQQGGVLRSNLVASCSDDGVYLNNAAATRMEHNTIIDTGGVQVRFAGSSADMEGNLVDGDIRSSDGGVLRLTDNRSTGMAMLYAGYHPVRSLFADAARFNFAWQGDAPRRSVPTTAPDLCGGARPPTPAYGAFEDVGPCMQLRLSASQNSKLHRSRAGGNP